MQLRNIQKKKLLIVFEQIVSNESKTNEDYPVPISGF